MSSKLQGKVVAITGGDQGIGRGVAERLARDGADVALCYRANKAGADEVVAGIEAIGRKATAIQCDVGKISDGQRFIDEAATQLGEIDILVNNAGLERHADFWDVTEADYDAVLNINLKGVFFITQAFVRHRMAVKIGGKVINVSSVHEELPFLHFHVVLCEQRRSEDDDTQPLDRTGAARDHHQQYRPGSHRNAHQQETLERPGEAQYFVNLNSA